MAGGPLVLWMALVPPVLCAAVEDSTPKAEARLVFPEGKAEHGTPAARRQRDLDRIYRKFLRRRLSARAAAGRFADRLDREPDDEAIRGLLFNLDPGGEREREKTAELVEELKRAQVLRSRLRLEP